MQHRRPLPQLQGTLPTPLHPCLGAWVLLLRPCQERIPLLRQRGLPPQHLLHPTLPLCPTLGHLQQLLEHRQQVRLPPVQYRRCTSWSFHGHKSDLKRSALLPSCHHHCILLS